MCVEVVHTSPFVFDSVLFWYKTQEICDKSVSKNPFMLKYYFDRYKTQEMCEKAVDFFLQTLKFSENFH